MRDPDRDPYQELGVSPGASDADIKRAFRRLAKQLHPDLHPSDASAVLRFREVVSAYQTLTGSDAPAAVARQRRPSRPAQAATMAAVFLLTVGSVTVAGLWWAPGEIALTPPAEPSPLAAASASSQTAAPSQCPAVSASASKRIEAGPQPLEAGQPEEAQLSSHAHSAPAGKPHATSEPVSGSTAGSAKEQASTKNDDVDAESRAARVEHPPKPPTAAQGRRQEASTQATSAAGPASPAQVRALAWADFRNARFGFSLAYPADLFVDGPLRTNGGTELRTRDGRASLIISAGMTATTLTSYRRALMDGPYRGATFDYTPRRRYWFVLSGTLADAMFYQRVTVSCDRRTAHSWKLVYPSAERRLYDRIVEEIHRRYSHSNGVGGRCGDVSQ